MHVPVAGEGISALRAQAGLVPVAHTIGTDFRPAPRVGVDEVLRWDTW
ncbi:hypothetical protein [Pseudonocardia sediminis]|nr:hypothetical protein [Pseudonocardia sediminis]